MTTALVYAPALAHDWPDHPEHAGRGPAIRRMLEAESVWQQMRLLTPKVASEEQLAWVHSQRLIDSVYHMQIRGGGLFTADTYATAESYRLARMAAGGCALAVDAIMEAEVHNALAVVRPPGHHAERQRLSGFCLFNNIALAARQAQRVHGLQRIAIVDFDVHHGNGTQDIFYEEPDVLFTSVHMYQPQFFYPGSGAVEETGKGLGKGATVNVPLPPRVGDHGYQRVFQEVLIPRIKQFQPELLLVSAGFDAHWRDPLAFAGLSLMGYDWIVHSLIQLAEEQCSGKTLFVLEGGYFEPALTYGALNLARALLGHVEVSDPLGEMPRSETDITHLLTTLKQLHLPS